LGTWNVQKKRYVNKVFMRKTEQTDYLEDLDADGRVWNLNSLHNPEQLEDTQNIVMK